MLKQQFLKSNLETRKYTGYYELPIETTIQASATK